MPNVKLISMTGLDNQLAYLRTQHQGCTIKNWWLYVVDGKLGLEIEFKTRGGATQRERVLFGVV